MAYPRIDGQFNPRFIVPRARHGNKVHEVVSDIATSTFINYPCAVRVNGEWLKPDQFQVSIGAIGACIQAYLDFFTAVQDGKNIPHRKTPLMLKYPNHPKKGMIEMMKYTREERPWITAQKLNF